MPALIYAAMDWLEGRQGAVEAELARRHLASQASPARMALFDLSSSWLEGRCCPLVGRGYSRDGKKGRLQIEYGVLADPDGRPVAVRVLPGNTSDPAAFTEIIRVVRDKFGLRIHSPLRGAAVGCDNWVPGPPLAGCGSQVAGVCLVIGQRSAGRRVHSGAGVPLVVTGFAWTV